MCSPRVGGEMRKGGQLSSEGPLALTVRYNCHSPGSAVVTLRMEMEDGTHDAVVWSWRKENGVLDAEVLAAARGELSPQVSRSLGRVSSSCHKRS